MERMQNVGTKSAFTPKNIKKGGGGQNISILYERNKETEAKKLKLGFLGTNMRDIGLHKHVCCMCSHTSSLCMHISSLRTYAEACAHRHTLNPNPKTRNSKKKKTLKSNNLMWTQQV